MRDEQKDGGVLAVVFAVVAMLLLCLFAVSSRWFYERLHANKIAIQRMIEAQQRVAELSAKQAETQELPEAIAP